MTLALKELQLRTWKTVRMGTLASLSSIERPRPAIVAATVTSHCCARAVLGIHRVQSTLPGPCHLSPMGQSSSNRGQAQDPGLSTFKVTCERQVGLSNPLSLQN